MTELCFKLGFDFLIVENSDDCEELSGEVACSFNKLRLHQLKVALISESQENEELQNVLLCVTFVLSSL